MHTGEANNEKKRQQIKQSKEKRHCKACLKP